jgi:tetratricopeptide (TPR) repeat protein
MKRKERHHLKENELAESIIAARNFVETNQRRVTTISVVVLLVVILGGSALFLRQRSVGRANGLLAEAMSAVNARVIPATPQEGSEPGQLPPAATMGATGSFATEEAKLTAAIPKLKAAADAYPDSEAGITARYMLASALASLGRNEEALQAFDDVLARSGNRGLYGRVALLGKAQAQASAGQLDPAIATLKGLAADSASDLPADAVLMELAGAYRAKGLTDEALKTYGQIIDQHPTSPYVPEAKRLTEQLKG